MDEIFADVRQVIWNPWYCPPQEPSEQDSNFIKHVYCEGARFHVLKWDNTGRHCSDPRCIINKR